MDARRFAMSLFAVVALLASASGSNGQEPQQRRGQAVPGNQPRPPAVGDKAPELKLKNLEGEEVELAKLTKSHPVVLLVLRGWPGYQCPICSRQVGEFLQKDKDFAAAGAKVVMVYPGPADLLEEHAKEFQGKQLFPDNFYYVTDPDYLFTKAWGLRWEAERETAYPSTFIVGKDGLIKFGVVSTTHGDRASAATVLQELAKLDESR
jgi:peroxiredoxin Q/BCP